MTNQEILALLDGFDRSSAQTMKLSTGDFSLELTRAAGAPAAPAIAAEMPAVASAPSPEALPAVTAPLVGTYYAAPGPDSPAYVAVGETVKQGQTLCLIEAMKMMSEVCAPCDAVIREVLKASGDLVAFDEPIFRYTPC